MSFTTFEPQSTSTPKKLQSTILIPNLCSTPRPEHVRYSLGKCAPLPVHSSTPQNKKIKKTFAPNIHRLIYPTTTISTSHAMKVWVL